jgi:hypothetical protein
MEVDDNIKDPQPPRPAETAPASEADKATDADKAVNAEKPDHQYGPSKPEAEPEAKISETEPPQEQRKRQKRIRGPPPRTAFTVDEFADANGLSVALLYKLWKAGLGPERMRVGRRVLISAEAAARWRRERAEANAA